MAVLQVLTVTLGCEVGLSKALAAEVAVISNFIWNDRWTFRQQGGQANGWRSRLLRLAKFNLICLAGIGWSVLLLKLQVEVAEVNLYLANLVAIVLVSVWNFWLSSRFGWKVDRNRH